MSDPSMATGRSGPSGPRAGFFQRFAALFIDSVVLVVPYFILVQAVGENLALVLYLAASALYFVLLEGSASGQTLGKKALGIRVADINGGGSIGTGRAFGRWAGRILSGLLLLGYLWALWDPEKQTWHDKIAKSVVVPAN